MHPSNDSDSDSPPFGGCPLKLSKTKRVGVLGEDDVMTAAAGAEVRVDGEEYRASAWTRMDNRSVLKLVHPGGFVEVHQKPVEASEIMAQNPRHSITRPDVFRNPHIVVRPDALLNTGHVFFIVPNRTLYRLLRAAN
ncbi:hypothetical protein J5N97_011400 [Dioscorea zingiberensis]|uniref:Uncharacterized protein n=1 Tax=Dioscorea zingiberensis TaxID=325984 RepID=A0A9D5HNB3_9LILI|nr:hypothetical protein J5N97_011400 [Dioscorea zingiberensis]